MKIKPLNDRILVRRTAKEAVTRGGLIVPESRQLKSRWGEVLAIGPGRFKKNSAERIPITEFKVGDIVKFRGNVGQEIDDDGHVVLRESEVDAVLTDPSAIADISNYRS